MEGATDRKAVPAAFSECFAHGTVREARKDVGEQWDSVGAGLGKRGGA